MIRRLYNLFLVFVICATSLSAQEAFVHKTVQLLEEYNATFPVEKIYLHLDKPYYAAGEYIYFRAYLTDGELDQYETRSNIIYVELSDANKQIVQRVLLYSDKKEFDGQIQLPASLPSANYHLRAYTHWMRNAGEAFFYHRDLYIGNAASHSVRSEETADYDVAFFPEGGRLLGGLMNKVAFKALGSDGFGKDVSGVLKDNNGQVVTPFAGSHLGMGRFGFVPEKDMTYTAEVEVNGIRKTYSLPAVETGMTLSARQSVDSLYITILSTRSQPEEITLMAQSRHGVICAFDGLHRGMEQTISLSKERFATGIVQFTLFAQGHPISERLVFIERNQDLTIQLLPDKVRYGDREKVRLQILVKDALGAPVGGHFSLAVTDDKVVSPSVNEENIKGTLLLDSDLKGYIERPGWYFAGHEHERKEALDILLCTQGWNRFSWHEVDDTPSTPAYAPESEFTITGQVRDMTGRAVKDGEVILFSNANYMAIAKADKQGRFGFAGINNPDTAAFILQGRTQSNKRAFLGVKIDSVDNKAPLTVTPLTQSKTLTSTYLEQAVLQKEFEKGLWTIDLPEEELQTAGMIDEESNRAFTGTHRNKPGKKQKKQTSADASQRKRSYSLLSLTEAPMLYVIDGVEIVPDKDFIEALNNAPARQIESIEVLRGKEAAAYGERGVDGVLILKTRTPVAINDDQGRPVPGIIKYEPEGYCVRKEFYIPPYNRPEVRQSPVRDRRTTILWDPVIPIDEEGKAVIEFYTADDVTTYSYVLEGISHQGSLGIGVLRTE